MASFEWALYDLRMSFLSSPVTTDANIVVVAIDEATIETLPHEMPLERTFLADLLETIGAASPSVIGLDILLDRPTTPVADQRLAATLATLEVPVVGVAALDQHSMGSGAPQSDLQHRRPLFDLALASPHLMAGAIDGVVRRASRPIPGPDGVPVQPFARAVAAHARAGLAAAGPEGSRPLIPYAVDETQGWPFMTVSATSLLTTGRAGVALPWLKDKVILIGKVTPFGDRHSTPLRFLRPAKSGGRGAPGVMIHAYQVAQYLDETRVARAGPLARTALALFAAVFGLTLALRLVRPAVLAAAAAGVVIVYWVANFALYAGSGAMVPLVAPTLAFGGAVFFAAAIGRQEERGLKRWLQDSFSLYLAPSVVERLVRNPDTLTLTGETRDVTVLFTDLEGFTRFIDNNDPDRSLFLLNAYFEQVIEVIFRHEGTIDKIMGDAVNAFFNAPADQLDHVARSVACALDIVDVTERFRQEVPADMGTFGRTRIGIHTGPAVMGNFGSRKRFNYTGHGTTVNLAARLEQKNKELGSQVCVTAAVKERAPQFDYRDLGAVTVRSIPDPVSVFEPVGRLGGAGEKSPPPDTAHKIS